MSMLLESETATEMDNKRFLKTLTSIQVKLYIYMKKLKIVSLIIEDT